MNAMKSLYASPKISYLFNRHKGLVVHWDHPYYKRREPKKFYEIFKTIELVYSPTHIFKKSSDHNMLREGSFNSERGIVMPPLPIKIPWIPTLWKKILAGIKKIWSHAPYSIMLSFEKKIATIIAANKWKYSLCARKFSTLEI